MSTAVNFKNINRIAIPAIIAGIAEPLLSITDTAMVGNIPENGAEALAAIGIVGSFLSMLIWILGQTRSAISAIISQYLGANNLEAVRTLPAQAIFFNILLSLILLFSTIFFIPTIFELLNATGKVLDYCIAYYEIRVWGFPLTLFTFAIFGIFRGLQNTWWPMIIAIIGAALNILLDYLLIYGYQNFIPALYLEGAAWASLLSQGVMALLSILLLWRKTDVSLRLRFPLNKELNRLAMMSLNLFVRSIALNTALILAVREATAYGTAYIGAHTIAINVWLFTAFFIDGYGGAGNIIGGRLLGAKSYKTLWILAKKVSYYGIFVSFALMIINTVFYTEIGMIFSRDTATLDIFYSMFFIVILVQPFNAIAFVFDGLFKGLGEMKYLRNTLLIATFLCFIPVLYLTKYFDLKLYGIWIAFAVWAIVRGLLLVLKFRRTYKPLIT